jgi:ABC-type Mn2+/Zn2+ transport system permease subunit
MTADVLPGWLVDLLPGAFETRFMQLALVAGLLTAVTTAVIGTWVVIRGLSFMGDALAHGVLPGIALAFLLGWSTVLGALAGAAVMVAGVNLVHRRTRLSDDVGIGLLFVGMLATGVIIVSRSDTFTTSLTTFLFGDILGIESGDLVLQSMIGAVVVGGTALFHRPFLALAFDEEKAELLGQRPRLAHAVMLGLVALTVVASFRSVGTMLVFGLLVAPPAGATLLTRRIPTAMVVAAAMGCVSVVAGLLISYHHDTAAAATIAVCAVGLFFVVLTVRSVLDVNARRHARAAPEREA